MLTHINPPIVVGSHLIQILTKCDLFQVKIPHTCNHRNCRSLGEQVRNIFFSGSRYAPIRGSLEIGNRRARKANPAAVQPAHSQCQGELLLGEVQRVAGGGDAVVARALARRQVAPQDGVVGHAEEGHQAVPRLVVEPHLTETEGERERETEKERETARDRARK